MTRPLTIVGNWKMYKTRAETFSFISALTPRLRPHDRVWIAPSFPALAEAVALKGHVLKIGAQNMHEAQEGAFTGEVSARMLKDCGVDFVLCGHSERRSLFHESDELIAKKVSAALLEGITPILCIGETEQQRSEGKTEAVLTMQLEKGLAEVEASHMSSSPTSPFGPLEPVRAQQLPLRKRRMPFAARFSASNMAPLQKKFLSSTEDRKAKIAKSSSGSPISTER